VEVTRELVLPAPPDEVWRALTEPERLEEWFANRVELDLERGHGVFRWDDGVVRRARVEAVEPGRRLDLVWWDEAEPEEATTVAFTLEEARGGTLISVTEATPGPSACAGGWTAALELQAMLAPLAA
jgi:uncharacterized protein YndB with AHSA1/START domain